jgi:CHAT domain-containing protein/Tfp pilus assembly protein PilF
MAQWSKYWIVILCTSLFTLSSKSHAQTQQQTITAQIDALLQQSNEQMYVKGQLKEGEDTARHALDLSRSIADRPRTMRSLHALASFYFYVARFAEALPLEQESVGLARQLDNKRSLAVALNGEASILRALGRFEEAIADFDQSAALTRELNDLPTQWTVTRNIGVLYMEMGDLDKAEAPLKEALRIANELKGEQWKNQVKDGGKIAREASLETLGNWEAGRERYSEAAVYLEQALATKPDIPGFTAEILTNLGMVRLKLGEAQKSVELLQQAVKVWETTGSPPHPAMLADLAVSQESAGQLQEALSGQQRALALVRESGGNPQYEWQIEGRLAHVERAMDRKQDALEHYQNAVHSIEILRASALNTESGRAFALATRRTVYEEIADLLHDLRRDAEALELAERGRARAFLDILAESRTGVLDELTPDQRSRENTILSRISAAGKSLWKPTITAAEKTKFESELTSAENDLDAFHLQVRQSNPRYASVQYPEPINVSEIQAKLLDEHTTLIEYLLGEKRSLVWVVTKEKLITAVLPSRKAIEEQVDAYRKLLGARGSRLTLRQSLAEINRVGGKLYQSIFQPIESAVGPSRNLIVVPDGALNYLPFEALVSASARKQADRPTYLTEKFAVDYGPSATALVTVLDMNREQATPPRTLLAFGDPVTPEAADAKDYAERGFSFARLPYTRDEILAIGRLFPVAQRHVYLGIDAREELVKTEKLDTFRFVHFASHGFLDEVKPGRSGILLSRKPDSAEDGILRMDEIMRLKMNAELVTLSACSTGLGKLINGEGILGLTRAFFYAGVRNVAVSLWNVNDSATAALMEPFYRNLNRGIPKGEAMRQAKLSLLHGANPLWQHPYFWAAFVIEGAGR